MLDHVRGRTQDFKTGVTIWEGWRKRGFISGRWGKGLNKKVPMMPSLNNCNNNDARVYESKLGELVEASKNHQMHWEQFFQRQRTGSTKN